MRDLPTFTTARILAAGTALSLAGTPAAWAVYNWHAGAGCLSAAGSFAIMAWSDAKHVRRERLRRYLAAREHGTQALRHVLDRGDNLVEYDPPTVEELVGGWEVPA